MKRKNSEQSDAYQRVEAELLLGEDLLWVGQPNPKHTRLGRSNVGTKAKVLSIIVGLQVLLVLGGAFFAISSSSTTTESGATTTTQDIPWVLVAVVVLSMLGGIAMMMFALFRQRMKPEIYAITDRRVLTISGDAVRSDGEQDIEFIERKMHRDGTGDIIYRRELQTSTGYYGGSVFAPQTQTVDVGLFGIPDPHAVEELMLEVFRPDAYRGKRKHDEEIWDDDDDASVEDLDSLISKSS